MTDAHDINKVLVDICIHGNIQFPKDNESIGWYNKNVVPIRQQIKDNYIRRELDTFWSSMTSECSEVDEQFNKLEVLVKK